MIRLLFKCSVVILENEIENEKEGCRFPVKHESDPSSESFRRARVLGDVRLIARPAFSPRLAAMGILSLLHRWISSSEMYQGV